MTEGLNKLIIKLDYLFGIITLTWIYTSYNKFIAKTKGVKGLNNLKTIGKLYIFRAPYSEIIIGNYCELRSSRSSNLIGINRYCMISTHTKDARILIGDNCGFSGISIGCRNYIEIGSNVLIGANAIITDTDWHSLNPNERLTGQPNSRPVIIENNVFIGANSIILKGTHIGENSVIGAGSIVSGEIPANVIAAGNPCKIIKKLG